MRRKFVLAAGAALLLAIGSVTVAFASSSTSRSADHRGVQVIQLIAKGGHETNIDLGSKGFSAGDQELVAANLVQDGKRVGEVGSVCQLVRVAKSSAACLDTFTLSLPKGQITTQGLVTSTPAGAGTFALAITGGTGAYQTAHGQMKVTSTSTDEVPLTLYLIL
jgi:hypothetical protein